MVIISALFIVFLFSNNVLRYFFFQAYFDKVAPFAAYALQDGEDEQQHHNMCYLQPIQPFGWQQIEVSLARTIGSSFFLKGSGAAAVHVSARVSVFVDGSVKVKLSSVFLLLPTSPLGGAFAFTC
jgi:hypothetical protein